MATTIRQVDERAESEDAGNSCQRYDPEQALEEFKTSLEGLSEQEARSRLERQGPNELAEEKRHPLLKFLSYFWGPIPWMIEAAAVLSALVRDWTSFAIILILLGSNAVVGFWEEFQAGSAVDALKQKLAGRARVRRGGTWRTLPARELVVGDVVRLRMGEIVPADGFLLGDDEVSVDQSALTGESMPVSRSRGQPVYSGSIVRQGETEAVISATGGDTYFGRTASLVESAHTTSHFQKAVLRIGNYLIILALALVAAIVLVGLFRGEYWLEIVRFSLILTVAAIPVAMPTVLSVTMAVGSRILSTKQAIVRRLAAVEEVAGIDVLCSDKTGTLTKNQLKLGETRAVGGADSEEAILAAALASRAEDEDPIDLAVIDGLRDRDHLKDFEIVHFVPFNPNVKRSEATIRSPGGGTFAATKGAVQVVLALSANADAVHEEVEQAVDDFASKGYRSLGVARRNGDSDWHFLAVLPLFDPPRDDSRQTIAEARRLGVKVKMVTGDQLPIAREIARRLDLGANILDASGLAEMRPHEGARQGDAIERADGFAQVMPEHKYHIVDVLQQRGHIVGMTGDGVNDAPALKKADAGIAVSGATDAARSAAAIVLTAPGLSVIVDAIRLSRRIFSRMTSYAIYRITETLRVLLFVTLSILVFRFYPVSAIMIVLLAILNDGAILSIAYDRARAAESPQAWQMKIILGVATVLGVLGVAETFGLLYVGRVWMKLTPAAIMSLIYLKLSVSGHFTVLVTRTRGPFWSHRPAWVLLGAVVGTQAIATLIVVYGLGLMAPIGWALAGMVWGSSVFWFLVEDRLKLAAYRVFDESQPSLLHRKRHATWRHAEPSAPAFVSAAQPDRGRPVSRDKAP